MSPRCARDVPEITRDRDEARARRGATGGRRFPAARHVHDTSRRAVAQATGKHAEALEYAVTAAERSRIQAAMVGGAVAPPPQAQGEAAADYSGGAAEYGGEVSDDDDPFGEI